MKRLITTSATLIAASTLAPAALIQLDFQGFGGTGLLATNERPDPATGGPGSGGEIGSGVFYDDVAKTLTINAGWGSANGFTDLSGPATAAHIHGNSDQLGTAGVLFNLAGSFTSGASDGTISYTSPMLDAVQESDLLSGLWYVNVHTAANPGGEIRGNMVPEPSTLLVAGLGLVGFLRRRR